MIRKPWTIVQRLSEPWHSTSIGQAAALALTLAALTWTVIGLGVATGVSGEPGGAPHVELPITLRVALWWVPAAAVWVVLLLRRYAALVCGLMIFAPALRIGSYLWAWGTHLGGGEGHVTGWYAAAIQAPLLVLIVLIALLTRMTRIEGIIR